MPTYKITRERLTGSSSAITVPYVIERTDGTPPVLLPLDAVEAVLTQAATDYGFAPSEWSFEELNQAAYRVSTVYTVRDIKTQTSTSNPPPNISTERSLTLTPPAPRTLRFALAMLQKSSAGINDSLVLSPNPYDGQPEEVSIAWPGANDTVLARIQPGGAPATLDEAVRRCAFKLNSDAFFGYPAGCLMLVGASSNMALSSDTNRRSLALNLQFAGGSPRTVTAGAVSLTGVLPFSHISHVSKVRETTGVVGKMLTTEVEAVYELEVFERTAYANLALPAPS